MQLNLKYFPLGLSVRPPTLITNHNLLKYFCSLNSSVNLLKNLIVSNLFRVELYYARFSKYSNFMYLFFSQFQSVTYSSTKKCSVSYIMCVYSTYFTQAKFA